MNEELFEKWFDEAGWKTGLAAKDLLPIWKNIATWVRKESNDDVPVAYAAKQFWVENWAYISHDWNNVQNWITLQHQYKDSLSYVGPIPLYTRPPSDELREAAKEVVSAIIALEGTEIEYRLALNLATANKKLVEALKANLNGSR